MRWHGEQTGRWTYRLILELATWLNTKHREAGFCLVQALSGHGGFNAYLRRFKKRDEEMCCYCDFPVDNAEHALFVCAKWGVARGALRQAVDAELTPDTMVSHMHQSERNWTLIKSFATLVIRRESSMGVESVTTGSACRNRIGACTCGLASRVVLAVRVARGRIPFIPPLPAAAS